jgi:hypothetical protein
VPAAPETIGEERVIAVTGPLLKRR